MLNSRHNEWHKHLLREGYVPEECSEENNAPEITKLAKPRRNRRRRKQEQYDRQTDN
ncbi:hypothetical protein [Pseudorhodoferax soli]|uniref:hypothetical protein n=1 Tax=Pseudorhodoferax soli TaxID=545864 RepID=UPI001B87EC6E|nr:hypothetical protein [Pseudorhodoferax soli]